MVVSVVDLLQKFARFGCKSPEFSIRPPAYNGSAINTDGNALAFHPRNFNTGEFHVTIWIPNPYVFGGGGQEHFVEGFVLHHVVDWSVVSSVPEFIVHGEDVH